MDNLTPRNVLMVVASSQLFIGLGMIATGFGYKTADPGLVAVANYGMKSASLNFDPLHLFKFLGLCKVLGTLAMWECFGK